MAEYIQDIINQIKGFINIEFGFCDKRGIVLGCSNAEKVGTSDEYIQNVIDSDEDVYVQDDYVYQKFYSGRDIDFIVFIKNPNQEAINYIHAISVCIINLRNVKESYSSKIEFFKSIIAGEVPNSDIPMKVRELGLNSNVKRAAFLIRLDKPVKIKIFDIIESIFPNEKKDFIIPIDDLNTVLIKEVKTEDARNLEKIATVIIEALNSEIMVKAYVGIGEIFENIADAQKSYKEAQMALDIREIFYGNIYVINFNNLGLGRLIYQLSKEFCKDFICDVFKDLDHELLDSETLLTVNKLFENNLHVSETSRQLFLHRNTLNYRLEKIQKSTGLDLKTFEDAIIFKIALLMREYLKMTPNDNTKTT